MKGQILSRIQSSQNIAFNLAVNLNRMPSHNTKIINESKIIKQASTGSRESPNASLKILSPSSNISSHRLLFGGSAASSTKKLFSTTFSKDIKRSINFQTTNNDKSKEIRNYKIPKRASQKLLPLKNFSKDINRQNQNIMNRQNTCSSIKNLCEQVGSQNYISNQSKINRQLFKQLNKRSEHRRKQLMRIYSKIDIDAGNKINIGSENNIRSIQYNQQATKDPQMSHKKSNIMMKTANVFNRNHPYLNFANKKFTIKSPQKKIPAKSLNRIPFTTLTQKEEDVSIQISIDQQQGQKQQNTLIKQNIQFGCSEIKQKQLQNDSSFLQTQQKNILQQLYNTNKKEQINKKKWKKLPSDFLKV